MLSGETANGPYFEQAVQVMAKTCVEAEGSRNYNALFQSVRNSVLDKYGMLSFGESLASSAVKSAIDIDAKMIVVLSTSGTTPRYVAKFRPGIMVICLTTNVTIARQSSGILQGVESFVVDDLSDSESLSRQVSEQAIRAGIAKDGDLMVVVGRDAIGPGKADLIRIDVVNSLSSIGRLSMGFHKSESSGSITK
jgi:pyruvate kinase